MVKRPVYIDSALGQPNQSFAGQVKLKLANPLKGVSMVRLRDAQIPRLDDITYIAIGLRCGRGCFIDNVQVPYNPSAVTTTGLFSVTGVSPGPPIFAILPIAQAASVNVVDYAAGIPYVYLNQERYEFEFKPPINSMDDIEIQLYRPPSPAAPSVFLPYDTTVFLITLDTTQAPSLPALVGETATNKSASDLRSFAYTFNALIIGTTGSKLLVGSVSSATAVTAFTTYLGQDGLLAQERMLYATSGAPIGTVSGVQQVTTQTTLNLEFDCTS